MTNGVSDGVEFAGTMLEIIDAADYDFHFSQYAAFANDSGLYVFDNLLVMWKMVFPGRLMHRFPHMHMG